MFINSLVIEKYQSPEYPYAVYFYGSQVYTFHTLTFARKHIHKLFGGTKDPTRFFAYPPDDGSDYDHSTIKPLDLIAFNLCAEARFVNFVTNLLKDDGPQHYERIINAAADDLDIGLQTARVYLFYLTEYDPTFWLEDQVVYLFNTL